MLSDDDYYFFEDDYYTDNTSDNEWYDHDGIDLDDYAMYGMGDSDHMDYEPYRPPEQSDQQAIYKELNIPNPNDVAKNALPLIDICASKVALNFPFAYVEDRIPPIPENVQLKIISYSFPQHMEKIKRYCLLNNGSSSEFDKAIRIVKSVKDLTQIGFHLSANVECRGYREVWYGGPPGKKAPYLYVNVKFDRGKITETNCPCENNSSWCFHVIAVCLARIFLHYKCVIKPPLSDSLNNLTTYAQLRTFTQYLIAEFSDRRIVESAQNVIDRMLRPKEGDTDAINETWGAPDPTAGPGLDETSQWLICEEGLKSRCTTLIHNSDVTEGCWGLNIADLDSTSSVIDRWKLSQIEKPVVEGYFSDLDSIPGSTVYSYNHHKKTYSREKSQEITKFLKTCEELLRDDFGYSLKAVQTFTVQLMDVIEERNKRNYYRTSTDRFESNFHLGCSPRPQTCWLFRDQLARLWRLLVLNPSISIKEREKIFTTLEVLEAKLHSSDGKKQLLEWDSQKHIKHLKNFTWESLQFTEDPFKNENLSEITVLRTTAIEASKHLTKSQLNDPAEQFPYPIDLSCGSFHSSVTVYCYLIEALSVYGKKEQTVHLSMNVALAIVRYYSTWLEGRLRVVVQNTLPVDCEDSVKQDNETGKKNKGGKKVKRKPNRKRARPGAKQAEEKNETRGNCSNETLFDQIKGIIPITSIAYLVDILEQHQDLLAEMLKLVKLRGLGLNEEDLMECDDITSDARSLIFRLGAIGLAMPKIQAPSLQIQVEWFNWEVYISQKVLKCSPSSGDIDFLKMLTSRMINSCEFGFPPPYALVMNLFHHSYKPDLSDTKSEDGVSVALRTVVVSPLKATGVSIHRRTFFECLRRHWVKLCETLLCRISVSSTQMSHALECLFTATAMIGSISEDVNIKANKKTTQAVKQTRLVQNMVIEKVLANIYLAYVLVSHAEKLKTTTDTKQNPSLMNVKKPKTMPLRRHGISVVVEKPKTPLSEQQKLLYETAITLASRAFAVKNIAFHHLQMNKYNHDYNFVDFMQRTLKWMCNLSNKIDAKAYDIILDRQRLQSGPQKCFNDEEVIKICTTMLESEQKRDEFVWVRVREALLTLMRPESDQKISEILQLCRNVEKEPSGKRVLLVPAVCKELLLYIPGSSLEERTKVEHLARAMTTMHTLVKKLEGEDAQENLEGVKELFSESSSSDKPGTSNESSRHRTIDPNLQLCFDLAIETVKHVDDNDRARGFEARRRFENICDIVAFVAKKACKSCREPSEDVEENPSSNVKADPFEEVYVSRFIEVLCTNIKDCLLLTDFFFELASRLFGFPQSGSFGRDRVLLSDDYKLVVLCESCSSLSVLLKRCIAGLLASTHGETMDTYLKETIQDNAGYLKVRAKNAKFYCGASLVSVLEVLKRLMSISKEDDFEPFSYKLSSKHPITKTAMEELNNKSTSSPGRHDSYTFSEEQLISSLLLRRMFSPALSYFDYDSDGWRY